MVARIDQRRSFALQLVGERQRRVVEEPGGDPHIADLEGLLGQVAVFDFGAERVERDREIGELHLPGKRFAQSIAEPARRIERPRVARHEQRGEERDPLDMIPVGVADEDRTLFAARILFEDMLAQIVRAGAAIDDQPGPAGRVDLHARGIAAIAHRCRAWLGNRASRSPEADLHANPLHRSRRTMRQKSSARQWDEQGFLTRGKSGRCDPSHWMQAEARRG